MKKIILLAVGVLIVCYFSAGAVKLDQSRFDLEIQAIKNSGIDSLNGFALGDQPKEEFNTDKDKSIYKYEYKSPRRAFLYSLIIPGWGQKYAGSTVVKPIFFLAVEATSWVFYFKNHSDGNNKTTEFQNYADEHWIEGDSVTPESYRGWLMDTVSTPLDTGFTHQLPDTKTQQYYEMIGKYDQFRAGWDDYWDDPTKYNTSMSPNRSTYMDLRKKANDLLDRADKFLIVAMANHLLSAFDAALSANRHNRKSGDSWLTVQAEMRNYSATEQIPILRLSCKF
jgi:hypothetical protein